MCGIVGYLGKNQAAPILLEGLSRMEYRGYDSAGLVVISPKAARLVKSKGRVAVLKEKTAKENLAGCLGIAHTRWATHGVPSDINSHPHADCKGEIFVVHNGIIENYQKLKQELSEKGHKFISETDTEVLAHLIESLYRGNLFNAVKEALKQVSGAYGIAVVCSKEPEILVAAKLGSPLAVGVTDDEVVVASDVTAILPVTQNVIYLEDGEMAVVKDGKLSITDLDNRLKEKQTQKH